MTNTINNKNIKHCVELASCDKLKYLKIVDKLNNEQYYYVIYEDEILTCDIIDIYDEYAIALKLYNLLKRKGEIK